MRKFFLLVFFVPVVAVGQVAKVDMTTVKQVLTNTGSAVGNEEHSHDCYNDFQIAIYALFKK